MSISKTSHHSPRAQLRIRTQWQPLTANCQLKSLPSKRLQQPPLLPPVKETSAEKVLMKSTLPTFATYLYFLHS
uniref:Uncharacterized protein n=1 Tax=Pararge aegeria TaxID=116150 RepID=S4PCY3_9NEOP